MISPNRPRRPVTAMTVFLIVSVGLAFALRCFGQLPYSGTDGKYLAIAATVDTMAGFLSAGALGLFLGIRFNGPLLLRCLIRCLIPGLSLAALIYILARPSKG